MGKLKTRVRVTLGLNNGQYLTFDTGILDYPALQIGDDIAVPLPGEEGVENLVTMKIHHKKGMPYQYDVMYWAAPSTANMDHKRFAKVKAYLEDKKTPPDVPDINDQPEVFERKVTELSKPSGEVTSHNPLNINPLPNW